MAIQNVFIIGAKSLGAYGGYETFVYKLAEHHKNNGKIKYHIACKANGEGCMHEDMLENVRKINNLEFEFENAHCFKIPVPDIGSAVAIYYDVRALHYCCRYIQKKNIKHPIVYILACRIGPFIGYYYRKIHKLGGRVYLNPDGHEWMRKKWNIIIRRYWKISEYMMVKHSDLIICDSINIEKYIHKKYNNNGQRKLIGAKATKLKTIYISYGADIQPSILSDDSAKFIDFLKKNNLKPNEYYLTVGRFVPENNYELMIREFMKSRSTKDFAVITNANQKSLDELEEKLGYSKDKRIKFVGTVYDQELLKKIRENAYGYFHGHEVGGTNPSLLEALTSTNLNLLLDVGFNKEVAKNSALYWNKDDGNLSSLIGKADIMENDEIREMGKKAKKRIIEAFSWDYISNRYEEVFCS